MLYAMPSGLFVVAGLQFAHKFLSLAGTGLLAVGQADLFSQCPAFLETSPPKKVFGGKSATKLEILMLRCTVSQFHKPNPLTYATRKC